MADRPRVSDWRGKPIEECSREELIEALNESADLLRDLMESQDKIRQLRTRGSNG